MAQNPPCRHPCNRSLLYTCTPACRLHYNPSPPFPPLLPQPIIHFLLLGKALVLQVHPATGCLFRKALGVLLQCYASRSSSGEVSDTSSSLALPKAVRGGGGCFVSSCLPLSVLFHTSCSQTSGEVVPVDTRLHKQWAPMYFPLI